MKSVYLAAILFLLTLVFSCSENTNMPDYFPMKVNNTWKYAGEMAKMQVTEETRTNDKIDYHVVYFDSLGIPIWEERHSRIDGRLYWTSFTPQSVFIPEIRFNPPLPSSPLSDRLGDKKVIESVETRLDSTTETVPITVEYEVESIETVELPCGLFPDCVKMRMTISYTEDVEKPYMAGTSYIWYARGIGPVSYILPSGRSTLISAKIGNRELK
ncbi:MAG TPA: hypothetical protein PLP19_17525 [bacterium]|nr:hypothetical protein [bacterium]HPN45295.1 hypothetical protein [bacterium]